MRHVRVAAALSSRRVLVTGVTGFIGEALLHRLLTEVPDVRIVAVVRARSGRTARDRMAQVLRKPPFAAAVAAAGGVDALLETRVEVLEADLAQLPALPADLDVVVHCAGDVAFDPPIDEALRTNVIGTRTLLDRVVEAVAATHRPVHYVHVSTAYVAGRRRGPVLEAPVEHDVDVEAETAHGLRMADQVDDASRSPGRLRRFLAEAEREHRREGPTAVAADAERRRTAWVADQLRAAGGERGRSLGWTDVYTFTKALGERVVEQAAAAAAAQGLPLSVSIVRPSIVESALSTPEPGWIEGFKMADPIILAFGRGELPEFPAAPDSVVDIVPVDHVVGALVTVAATPPPVGAPAYFHVSSGARNPLTFRRLYELVRDYFDRHPFDVNDRGGVALPTWQFPGARKVESLLTRGERAHRLAEQGLGLLVRSDRVRSIAHELDRTRARLDGLRRYADLYRAYTQAELCFVDDHALALHRGLDAEDRARFGFDTAVVDWTAYIRDVHCPAVTKPVRAQDAIRRRRRTAAPATRVVEPADGDAPVLAVFDMDGTLMSSTVIESFLWLRAAGSGRTAVARETARLLGDLPGLIRAERHDRGAFLRAAYRRYAGADLAALDALVDEVVAPHVLSRLSGTAVRRVREHREVGHRTVLLTGAVRVLTRPLAPLFDVVVAADLAVDARGRATGYLVAPPVVGEARAAWLRHYADREGIDLDRCYGYADSASDLPMLRAVGRPTAVSPDVALARVARSSRWPVEDWRSAGTALGLARAALPDPALDATGASRP